MQTSGPAGARQPNRTWTAYCVNVRCRMCGRCVTVAAMRRLRRDSIPSGHDDSCQMTARAVEELWYGVSRLTVPIPPVREFQAQYEAAVPSQSPMD
jgi:hypothetical protein